MARRPPFSTPISPTMQKALRAASTEWAMIPWNYRQPTIRALLRKGLIETSWHDTMQAWRLTEAGNEAARTYGAPHA